MPDPSLNHGAVLITGASTGIGRTCALHLARLGFRVYAGVRRETDGTSLENDARGVGPGTVRTIRIDVTDTGSITAAAAQLSDELKGDGLTGLVNNAGIGVVGPVEFISMEDWRRQFDVNFFGVIATTQAMLPLLRDRIAKAGPGSARIVNMSSIAGRIAQPIMGPYCASKFALESLTDSLRQELRSQGIFVCSVNPGAIDTPIWKKGEQSESRIPSDHEARKIYGALIDGVVAAAKKAATGAIPPQAVADVVAKCLTADRPKARTFVGRDAKTGALAKRLIPDRWFDAMLRRYLVVKKSPAQ